MGSANVKPIELEKGGTAEKIVNSSAWSKFWNALGKLFGATYTPNPTHPETGKPSAPVTMTAAKDPSTIDIAAISYAFSLATDPDFNMDYTAMKVTNIKMISESHPLTLCSTI